MTDQAIIFAAGLGTRLRPLTHTIPKALVPVKGFPALYWVIKKLLEEGVKKIIINTHHFAPQFVRFLEEYPLSAEIILSEEKEYPLETGGGLMRASQYLDNRPFFAVNADILSDISLQTLSNVHHQIEPRPWATLAVTNRKSSRLLHVSDQKITGWSYAEKGKTHGSIENTESRAFSGIQIWEYSSLKQVTEQGVFSIMEVYKRWMLKDKAVLAAYDHSGDMVCDIGKPNTYKDAQTLPFLFSSKE